MFDPHRATLRYKIASGRCLGVTWLAMGSAAIAEVAARSKPDAIIIDMQHGLWERREMEYAIGLIAPEIPVIVRVAENTPYAIGSALDAGAEGVMVPLIETGKQARNAVASAKYPPDGVRSGGGVRPLADFAEYVEGADKLVTILMIETDRGVDNVRDIARTEGVDMVFVGTGDLSLSIGAFPVFKHDHTVACATIHDACKAAWTPCGIFTPNVDMAKMRRGQGYRMVVTCNDMDVLSSGFSRATTAFAAQPPAAPAEVIENAAAPARLERKP